MWLLLVKFSIIAHYQLLFIGCSFLRKSNNSNGTIYFQEAEENGTICHSFTFNPPEMRRLGYGSPGV